jgi:hypothetical protein
MNGTGAGMDSNADKILAHLYVYKGKENAITGESLGKIYGVNIKRVQSIISKLRAEGNPICACDSANRSDAKNGYYIPLNRKEADEFFKVTTARAKKTFITIANVAKALNASFGTDEYQLDWIKENNNAVEQ